MLVSHKYKFIFIKTTKTAGTSIESYFEQYCMPPGLWTEQHYHDSYESEYGIVGYRGHSPDDDCKWLPHQYSSFIKDYLGDIKWNSYFKFCSIRNPFERLISAFFWYKHQNNEQVNMRNLRQEFEEWLLLGKYQSFNNYLIDGKFALDDIIHVETLSDDMERICQRIGVPWNPMALPKFKSEFRPAGVTIDNIYSEKAKEIVSTMYAFDLKYFYGAT